MIHSITAGIAGLETALGLVAELLSITALFTALNFLSNLIRFTYKAGKFTGYIWFTFVVPAILWIADGISYINSFIDWQFVAATFVDCLKTIVTILIVMVDMLRQPPAAIVHMNSTLISITGRNSTTSSPSSLSVISALVWFRRCCLGHTYP